MGDSPLGAIWAILGGQHGGMGTIMAPMGVCSPNNPQIAPEGEAHSPNHLGMGSRPYGLWSLNCRGYWRGIAIGQHTKCH